MQIANKATGEIFEISPWKTRLRRMQKRVKAWADVIDQGSKLPGGCRLVMITLTYRDGADWRPGQIRNFMLTARKALGDRLLAYSWVGELQRRGAVHYHVLVLVKRGTDIPAPDEAGWWTWGLTRRETAKTPFYVLKYTGKEHQKTGFFPKGMRMFAVWVSPRLSSEVQRWFFRLSALPAWFKAELMNNCEIGTKFYRFPGGGWEAGGEVYKSPWTFIGF